MATGPARDLEALTEGLRRWVAACPGQVPGRVVLPMSVVSVAVADGGLANETLLVDLGDSHPGVVVRLPPLVATFPEYELGPQTRVQNAVAAAGVPAPSPAVLVSELEWLGSPFLAMPRVPGRVPGAAPIFDEWLTALDEPAQRRLHDGLIDALVAIHRIDCRGLGLERPDGGTLEGALDEWSRYIEWAGEGEPLPVLIDAMAWCRGRVPDTEAPAGLLWGDVRLGNLMVDQDLAVVAVLDWDLASIGPVGMDLGWYFGLEFMMEQLFERRVPGFPSRQEALARYVAQSGRPVEVEQLDWHEVFALSRALAINDRHQRIAGSRRRAENPMGPILRARMELAEA
ncbi:MAG TPA: phosphotransferase family protein [Acidimicrobiales bacterium]